MGITVINDTSVKFRNAEILGNTDLREQENRESLIPSTGNFADGDLRRIKMRNLNCRLIDCIRQISIGSISANYRSRKLRINASLWSAILLILSLAVASPCVLAQATGSIHGVARDASGALVPGAQVTVTNISTGQIRSVTTNDLGAYVTPLLPVGDYEVKIAKNGFQTFIQQGVTVAVNTDVLVNGSLAVGNATAEVTVTGAPPMLQTATTNMVQVVGHQQMVDLPLNGRDVLQLTALAPGVSNDPRVDEGVLQGATVGQGFYNVVISANGARPNENNYLLDNVDNNDNYTMINAPYPNPDAVQEFSVQASSFDAQYGGIGAVVNVVTKSGTNTLHGSAYDFLRNYAMDANNYFTGPDSLKRNQFGAALGGPVVISRLYNGKSRTFFFGSYQGLRESVHTGKSVTAPTAAMEAGDFSAFSAPIIDPDTGLQFPENKIPASRIDPVSANILKYMPSSAASNHVFIFAMPPIVTNDNEYTARVDYNINDSQKLSFRFMGTYYDNPWVVKPNNLYYYNIGSLDHYIAPILDYTKIISSNLVNSFDLGFHMSKALLIPPASLVSCCTLTGLGGHVDSLPESETLNTTISGWAGTPEGYHRDQRQESYLLDDHLVYQLGRHQLSFGGDIQRYRIDYISWFEEGAAVTFSGQITAPPGKVSADNSFADMLLGRFSTFRQQTASQYRLYNNYFDLYGEDHVQITPKLTLTAGLRWNPVTYPKDAYHQNTTFIPGEQSTAFPNAPLGLVSYGDPGITDPVVPGYWHAFAPRVGFAYQMTPKTVVRTSYGIFWDRYMMISYNRTAQSPPWVTQATLTASGVWSNPYGSATPFSVAFAMPSSNYTFIPYGTYNLESKGETPGYVQSWNLIVERQVMRDLVMRAAYVGSHGTHLLVGAERNPAIYAPGATLANENARRPYQPIGSMTVGYGLGWSKYEAGQFSLEKRMSHGFLINANYTVSKSMDISSYGTIEGNQVGPNPFNWNANRGLSDFNIPQRMTVSGVVVHPSFAGRDWLMRNALGGWQSNVIFTAQAGTPLNIVSGVDNALSGVGGQFPDLTGVNWRLTGGRSKSAEIGEWFNTSAFKQNALGTPGDGGRNKAQVPGMWNVDYSLFKRFKLRERSALECRGEFFNFFNHTNLGAPNASVVSSTFGRITSAADPRIVQVSLKINF